MREKLVAVLTKIIMWILGYVSIPDNPDRKLCPVCGEDWDGEEIFCYNCGYEIKDEEHPLHPPPDKSGRLIDPDGLIDESGTSSITSKLETISTNRGIDLAVFLLPSSLREELKPRVDIDDGKVDTSYSLDGFSHSLYNDWRIGTETNLSGLLITIDPSGTDRVLVQGRNGPGLKGSDFRKWYEGYTPQLASSNGVAESTQSPLVSEIDHILTNLENM